MSGGLFDPLGTDRPDLSSRAPRPSAGMLAAVLVLAALAVLLAVSWLRDDGDRGRPVAVAPIEHVQAPPKPPVPPQAPTALPPAPPVAAAPGVAASPALPPVRDDQEVEIQNGVRIVRPRRDGPSAAGRTIRVPDATETR